MRCIISSWFSIALAICLLVNMMTVPAYAKEAFSDNRHEKIIEPVDKVAEDEQEAAERITISENETIDEVPNYYQNYFYYSFIPYGNGTLGSSGCGITCLAMVATYMLDDPDLTSDILAEEFGSYRGTNLERMEYASETLGLTYEKTFKWKDVVSALEEGKIAIVLVNSKTKFTGEQHFILLTGINDDGKIMVNDPNYRNYETMASGFENGFEQWEITSGFQGAWIYDKQDMNSQDKGI